MQHFKINNFSIKNSSHHRCTILDLAKYAYSISIKKITYIITKTIFWTLQQTHRYSRALSNIITFVTSRRYSVFEKRCMRPFHMARSNWAVNVLMFSTWHLHLPSQDNKKCPYEAFDVSFAPFNICTINNDSSNL